MTPRKPSVLLVEDNEDHAFLARRALEAVGAEVTVAPGGPEALEMIVAWPGPRPDLVVLDLSMPMVDGLEVLGHVRSMSSDDAPDDDWRRVPVVILSTSKHARDVERAYAAGANSYVCKPSGPAEYRAALASLGVYWLSLNTSLTRADRDVSAVAVANQTGEHPSRRQDEPRHIVFAEDNEDHAFLIRRALKNTGADLVHASDGDEAVRILGAWEGPAPALILLDMNMPRMGGLEVLDRLRANPRFATVPIVIFSTSRLPSDIGRAYDLRANSYVSKPGAFNEFRSVLEQLSEYWVIVNEV